MTANGDGICWWQFDDRRSCQHLIYPCVRALIQGSTVGFQKFFGHENCQHIDDDTEIVINLICTKYLPTKWELPYEGTNISLSTTSLLQNVSLVKIIFQQGNWWERNQLILEDDWATLLHFNNSNSVNLKSTKNFCIYSQIKRLENITEFDLYLIYPGKISDGDIAQG